MKGPPAPWWSPHLHADRRPFLLARNGIVAAIRRYFEAEGFTEVACAALQVSPGNEAHLHGFATELVTPGDERKRIYLHTSPEFACKKLLAAGEQRIFDFSRVYRNRERGALHAPEFTMLEWYRAHEPYDAVMSDCLRLLSVAAEAAGTKRLCFRDRSIDARVAHERITVAEAFARFAAIDLLATLRRDGSADREALAAAARSAGVKTGAGDTWSDIFSRVLVERVEPNLGRERPTLLCEYPRIEAALARAMDHDLRLAERFELYVCGVELANGFGELTDPLEQRRRFDAEMAERERVYGERYPIDEEFLAALATMPPASGVALGLDRLVMLATGASRIDQVQWTPPPS